MDQERKIEIKLDGFVGIFENVFEDDFIDELIKFFESKEVLGLQDETKSTQTDRDMTELQFADFMTIQSVPPMFSQHFFGRLWEHIYPQYTKEFAILGALKMQGEGLKMKRIKPGGGFHSWHCEGMGDTPRRRIVAQLYLNDIDEAGETEFLYQNKRISPKRNRLLLWPADWTHTHRGNPPIGDTNKYILTTWLEEQYKGN
ncbi:2OG-Fe(II) oxygenase [bacterium]|nr:2OG-Fe(II) oxygenase [bacterium]MDC1007267.1 2OG-Fe(II) oxygenase [bacterium]